MLIPVTICYRYRWHRWEICHQYQQHKCYRWQNLLRWYRWSTLICEYFRKFRKNSKWPYCYFQGLGEVDSWKNLKQKSRETVPLSLSPFFVNYFNAFAGWIADESCDGVEHPGTQATATAATAGGGWGGGFDTPRLLRTPQDGLTHRTLLWQRRICRPQDLSADVCPVLRLSLVTAPCIFVRLSL
jgi:hypothetical protein